MKAKKEKGEAKTRAKDEPVKGFNETEYLEAFQAIDDALEQNMRTERDETFDSVEEEDRPRSSIDRLLREHRPGQAPPADRDQRVAMLEPGNVPFSSSSPTIDKGSFRASASQADSVIYRQARRGKRTRHGRRGIWQFMPHIGHRKRHWIQRNFINLVILGCLAASAGALYVFRIRPGLQRRNLEPFPAANRAHREQNYVAAIEAYREFLQKASGDSLEAHQARYYSGCCYEVLGQEAKAREEYQVVYQAYLKQYGRRTPEDPIQFQREYSIPDVYPNAIYALAERLRQAQESTRARELFVLLLDEFPQFMFAQEIEQRLAALDEPPAGISPAAGAQPLQTEEQPDEQANP